MRSRFYALMVAISKVWLATNKSGLGDVAARPSNATAAHNKSLDTIAPAQVQWPIVTSHAWHESGRFRAIADVGWQAQQGAQSC
jgi:hypothetical protein